jgi:hypothetical protein
MNAFGLTPTSMLGMGDQLMSQVSDETQEERRRRLMQQKLAQLGSTGSMSPAGAQLFGSLGMGGLR